MLLEKSDFCGALRELQRCFLDASVAAEAKFYYANTLRRLGRIQEATDIYLQSLADNPNSISCLCNLGTCQWQLGKLDEALDSFDKALSLDHRTAHVWYAKGNVLKDLGRLEEAIAMFDEALRLAPDRVEFQSGRLYALNYSSRYSPRHIAAEHFEWAKSFNEQIVAPKVASKRSASKSILHIGYVSSHFYDHAVNSFFEPLLSCHDTDRFQISLYSNSHHRDAVTERLQSKSHRFCSIVDWSDDTLAQQISDEAIDVLVDLNGHMGNHRLLAFAKRLAPIQVSYLGYQATTGLQSMDYRITDEHCDPFGMTEAYHSEKLVRISPAFFCYQPSEVSGAHVASLPAERNNYITFGSFNAVAKLSDRALEAWCRILTFVPRSRLQILSPDSNHFRANLKNRLSKFDVDESRIYFVNRGSPEQYFQTFAEVDIALDSFPFNGHTTTCDSLWMGVPVVTLCGNSYVQRFESASHSHVGLSDLVASSEDQYIQIASSLANDLDRLAKLRGSLRETMRQSAIMNASLFTSAVESAFVQLANPSHL